MERRERLWQRGFGLSTIVGWMKDEKNIIENSKIVNSKKCKIKLITSRWCIASPYAGT